jgi:hypothetical protein
MTDLKLVVGLFGIYAAVALWLLLVVYPYLVARYKHAYNNEFAFDYKSWYHNALMSETNIYLLFFSIWPVYFPIQAVFLLIAAIASFISFLQQKMIRYYTLPVHPEPEPPSTEAPDLRTAPDEK